jgi:hypothetical protein
MSDCVPTRFRGGPADGHIDRTCGGVARINVPIFGYGITQRGRLPLT